jgi:hypothetical protein
MEPWEKLFRSGDAGPESVSIPMWLLRRNGQPLLLLPSTSTLAAHSLELYSPQTKKARMAKALLRISLRLGLPVGLASTSVRIDCDDAFAKYLSQVSGAATASLPEFALLAGNPRTGGQRSILLLFDSGGKPASVVKAGSNPEAFRLIEREEIFLKSVKMRGVPEVRSAFRSEAVRAFRMNFYPGSSPKAADWEAAENLLSSWVAEDHKLNIAELPMWQRFETSVLVLPPPIKQLGVASVFPTLYHGDFAPWNIKAQNNSWILLDWERGELAGMPLWDWLHYLVQPAVLVDRCAPEALIERLESWLQSAAVTRYSERCGITGLRRALAAAYFQYCIHVIRPTEGLAELRELGDAVLRRWFPGEIAL